MTFLNVCTAVLSSVAISYGVWAGPSKEGRLAGLSEIGTLCSATHVGFFGNVTTLTAVLKGKDPPVQSLYYKTGGGAWKKIPVDVKGPHSIARLPNGHWIINDTGNHRMIELAELSGSGEMITRSELGGFPLKRPHDQIVDPHNGDVYVVDGNRRLFRFKDLRSPSEAWTFTSDQMGYARSLSWLDGHLHVINTSRGEVIRIDDYGQRRFTTFRSPRPKAPKGLPPNGVDPSLPHHDFDGGALANTGLVLNDVEKVDGWYYGTNFFSLPYSMGADTAPGRLIRWRSWSDFERGHWQDLSSYIPAGDTPLVPYYLTAENHVLYVPVLRFPDERCEHGQILELDVTAFRAN